MLLNDRSQIFLGRRMHVHDSGSYTEQWQMPQGGVGQDETPTAAALRELREEIGTDNVSIVAEHPKWLRYDLPGAMAVDTFGPGIQGQIQKWFVMQFLGTDSDIDIATPQPEFDAWKWVSPKDVLSLIVPFKRRVYSEVIDWENSLHF